jgi:hypothetical protein
MYILHNYFTIQSVEENVLSFDDKKGHPLTYPILIGIHPALPRICKKRDGRHKTAVSLNEI